jgi:hypothetical protein
MIDYCLSNADGENIFVGPLDISYDATGRVATTTGLRLVDQLVIKSLMTQYGSSKINPLYGAAFSSMIGAKLTQVLSGSFMVSEVQRVVSRIANFLIKNPNTQASEQIASIDNITIDVSPDDPRTVNVGIFMTTNSGDSRELMIPVVMN